MHTYNIKAVKVDSYTYDNNLIGNNDGIFVMTTFKLTSKEVVEENYQCATSLPKGQVEILLAKLESTGTVELTQSMGYNILAKHMKNNYCIRTWNIWLTFSLMNQLSS